MLQVKVLGHIWVMQFELDQYRLCPFHFKVTHYCQTQINIISNVLAGGWFKNPEIVTQLLAFQGFAFSILD